ncbi:MAG: energy transducer TonB [Acidobacteriota bacterium]
MKRPRLLPILTTLLAVVCWSLLTVRAEAVRMAIVLPAGDVNRELRPMIGAEGALEIELLDEDLTLLARQGSGYDGRLNLTRAEARGLGLSLGSDFYILGQVLETPRRQADGQVSFEALAALFLVESRTGELRRFHCVEGIGADAVTAGQRMRRELAVAWEAMAKVIAAAPLRNGREPEIDQPAPIEIYIDDDGLASRSAGPGSGSVRPPLFQRHLKPLYPEVAARLGIEATVELTAVFRADGQVDQVELQRWAGFGLDESAVATVRQLRFEPATQDRRPVSFRGLVRYNFRRPTPQAIRNSARSREEIDRLKRSLQDLLKTRPVP